jgi:hypothetical protein
VNRIDELCLLLADPGLDLVDRIRAVAEVVDHQAGREPRGPVEGPDGVRPNLLWRAADEIGRLRDALDAALRGGDS